MDISSNWQSLFAIIIDFIQQKAFGILLSIIIIIAVGKIISNTISKYVKHERKKHSIIKWTRYITVSFVILWILLLYNSHVQKDTPFYLFFIGILLAGVAISLRDVFSNIVAWVIIVSGKGFNNGDRIKVGSVSGDVIDVGLLRTIIAEIGDWVDADQSTGRLISIPNNMVLGKEIINYTQGYDFIWDEIRILITFESNWKKAEKIINDIAYEDFDQKKEQIQERLKKVKRKYFLRFNYITPKVYVTIKDSVVVLASRYIVRARPRRTIHDSVSREILSRFDRENDIDFAYPTMRIYKPEN